MSEINKAFFEVRNGCYLTLAFRVRDSFDDSVLENEAIIVYLNDKFIKPLRKSNGYYVITDIPEIQFDLKITSHNYFDKTISIKIDEIKREDKCIDIYLVPHYKYRQEPSKIYIEGEADSETLVFAAKLSNRSNIRFSGFDKKHSLLKVSNPAMENLSGRVMAVVDCEKNSFQEFFVQRKVSEFEYEIDNNISKTFKSSSPIQKAYVTKSDSEGKYKLYISSYNVKDENYIVSFYKDDKKIYKVIDFNKNIENIVNN